MKHQIVPIAFLSAFLVAIPTFAQDSTGSGFASEAQNHPKSEPKAKMAALTGCMDEQDGRYVLVDDRSLNPMANLEPEGFPKEGFAKHVGHKVTVRGTLSPAGATPIFRVRSIEAVSDTCVPQPNQGKQ